jgi:hypothetical protein
LGIHDDKYYQLANVSDAYTAWYTPQAGNVIVYGITVSAADSDGAMISAVTDTPGGNLRVWDSGDDDGLIAGTDRRGYDYGDSQHRVADLCGCKRGAYRTGAAYYKENYDYGEGEYTREQMLLIPGENDSGSLCRTVRKI